MQLNKVYAEQPDGSLSQTGAHINRVGIGMGLCGMVFLGFTALYFQFAFWVAFLFMATGFLALFWTYVQLPLLAKFMLCVVNATLYALLQCYFMPDNAALNPGLFTIQICFWFVPFILFSSEEKVALALMVVYNILLTLSIPFLNNYFTRGEGLLLNELLNMLILVMAAVVSITTTTVLIASKSTVIGNLRAIILAMQKKSDGMMENEKKLSKYIQEVERTQEEERKRKWASDGIASVAEIMRSGNDSTMYDQLLSSLVKHLNANQAALFIAADENEETVLHLQACYAYDRKKFITKAIFPGEGMVGQCFLEKASIYITHLKKDYINITSGLGSASPRVLLIVPMLVNEDVQGVIEIASFNAFEKFQIEFVEQVAGIMASTIHTIKIAERTKKLLEQAQLQTEQIRTQEEEMRQNIEELTATQEEMRRKESHLQAQSDLMEFVIDNIPFPVFIKDEHGCYVLVNKAEAQIFNEPKSAIIGFDDSKFVKKKEEMDRIRESDRQIIEENVAVHFPEQIFPLYNGTVKVFKTSKIPFFNKLTQKTNILGVSIDLSEVKRVEWTLSEEIENLKLKLKLYEDRERMMAKSVIL
jgi:PAS domain-containing protein